eukprot:6176296-Pleurochrysis_carterae.AAC.2
MHYLHIRALARKQAEASGGPEEGSDGWKKERRRGYSGEGEIGKGRGGGRERGRITATEPFGKWSCHSPPVFQTAVTWARRSASTTRSQNVVAQAVLRSISIRAHTW